MKPNSPSSFTLHPSSFDFIPLPWQIAPWRCTAPIMLLTGSAGGGKSRLAAEKLNAFCKHYPGATALMLRKTRESMINSTVLFMERAVVGPDQFTTHIPSKHRFEYSNGSILAYGGMADEAQREQIRSIGQAGAVDIAWMEEANRFTESDYQELLTRMRGRAAPWSQIILSTNPDSARHWINTRLILGQEAAVFYSTAADNTTNPPHYQTALDMLTGIQRKRLRDGIWCQAEGVVYNEFDPALHVQYKPGPWPRITAAMDEGYTNPAVILVIGHDSDGRRHIIAEFYQTNVLQEEHVAQAKSLAQTYPIERFTVDASAAGLIAALRAANLPAIPATKSRIIDGINSIKEALRLQPDGLPRLTVSPDCPNTIMEFESYAWDEPGTNSPKETPIKANDHAMDALRYDMMETAQPALESAIIQPPKDPFWSPRPLEEATYA